MENNYKVIKQERTNGTFKFTVFDGKKEIYCRPHAKTDYPACQISTVGKKLKISFSSSGKFLTKGIRVPIVVGTPITRGRKRMGKRVVDLDKKPLISVNKEDSVYVLLCKGREALRGAGIFCTWRKMMQELYSTSTFESALVVLKNYVEVRIFEE